MTPRNPMINDDLPKQLNIPKNGTNLFNNLNIISATVINDKINHAVHFLHPVLLQFGNFRPASLHQFHYPHSYTKKEESQLIQLITTEWAQFPNHSSLIWCASKASPCKARHVWCQHPNHLLLMNSEALLSILAQTNPPARLVAHVLPSLPSFLARGRYFLFCSLSRWPPNVRTGCVPEKPQRATISSSASIIPRRSNEDGASLRSSYSQNKKGKPSFAGPSRSPSASS